MQNFNSPFVIVIAIAVPSQCLGIACMHAMIDNIVEIVRMIRLMMMVHAGLCES